MKGLIGLKKTTVWVASIFLLSASFTPIISANAEMTSHELVKKKQKIDTKITKLNYDMQKLHTQLESKMKAFRQTQSDITDTQNELTEVEERMQERMRTIDERMLAYQSQKSTVNVYIDVLLASENLSDLLSKSMSIKTIIDADRALLNQQTDDKKELESLQATLLEKKVKLQKQFQEMQEQEKDLEVKKVENKALSLKLKEQIATKKKKEKLARERMKQEKEAARLKALAEKEFLVQQAVSTIEESSEQVGGQGNAGNGSNGAKVTDTDQQAPTVEGSKKAKAIIAEASKYLGTAYVWGGSNPSTGFDCSGLTQWSFKQAGVSIPRTAATQYLAAKKISASEARAGDLVFFSYGNGVAHVGIYLGNGRMLDSQNNGVVVESLDWWNQYLVGYGRFL